MEIQKLLFSKIKKSVTLKEEWAREIAQLLKISREAVYRRERGEVKLDIYEVEVLCRQYEISLDNLIEGRKDTISFSYNNIFVNQGGSYNRYLQNLRNLLKEIESAHAKEILFCSDDIPIFHFMGFTELTFFKLYIWSQSLRNIDPHMPFEEFANDLAQLELEKLFSDISKYYRSIPSKEIWTEDSIGPIINQLVYFNNIGSFIEPDTKFRLHKQLCELVSRLERNTIQECKRKGVDFAFYLSPIDTGISHMLCLYDANKLATIKLYTINSISTDNLAYITDHLDWIKALMSKSSCLSSGSEELRIQFFKNLRLKLSELKRHLN